MTRLTRCAFKRVGLLNQLIHLSFHTKIVEYAVDKFPDEYDKYKNEKTGSYRLKIPSMTNLADELFGLQSNSVFSRGSGQVLFSLCSSFWYSRDCSGGYSIS